VEELEGVTAFRIYPNPATTEIRYEYITVQPGNLTITLTVNRVRQVLSRKLDANNGDHQGVME